MDTATRNKIIEGFKNKGFKLNVLKKDGKLTSRARDFISNHYMDKGNVTSFLPKNVLYDAQKHDIVSLSSKKNLKKSLRDLVKSRGIKLSRFNRKILVPVNKNIKQIISGKAIAKIKFIDNEGKVNWKTKKIDFNIPYNIGSDWKNIARKKMLKKQILKKYDENIRGDIEKLDINTATIHPKKNDIIEIKDIKLKKIGALIIDGFEKQSWNTETDRCVFDYIENYYKDDKNVPKKAFNKESYELFFGGDENGASVSEICDWCNFYRIPMIAVDCDYNKILTHYPTNSIKTRSLIFMAKNGHIYPILEKHKRKSLSMSHSNLIKGGGVKIIKEIKEKEKKLKIEFIEADTRDERLYKICEKMLEKGKDIIPKNIISSLKGISSFILEDKKYIFKKEEKSIIEKYLGDEYKGETISKYVNEVFKNIELPYSKPNSITNKLINQIGVKDKAHLGGRASNNTIEDFKFNINPDWKRFKNPKAFDINKCHRYILQNPKEKWGILTFKDSFIDFDYNKHMNIPLGLYYIETEDETLFLKTGLYSSCMVMQALKDKIIKFENIKKLLIPSKKLEKNTFSNIDISKIIDKNNKFSYDLEKNIYNSLSGCLGKSYKKISKNYISMNYDECHNYLIKNNESKCTKYEKIIIDPYKNIENLLNSPKEIYEFYCYGKEEEILLDKNNVFMYHQILDQQALMLYNYSMEFTKGDLSKILYRKSDCIVIEDPDMEHIKKSGLLHNSRFGLMKEEELPTSIYSKEYTHNKIDFKQYEGEWKLINDIKTSNDYNQLIKIIDDKESIMINSPGGYGKSYMIEKISEHYGEDNIIKCAFTNVAAKNIKGKTIHSTFKYDEENESISKLILKKYMNKKYKCIIIDEISTISGNLWSIFDSIKDNINIPIICFGDWFQLKPIDNIDYKNHNIIKRLTNNYIANLQWHEKCRQTKEYNEILNDIRINKTFDENQYEHIKDKNELPKFNICFHNDIRREINEYLNMKEKHGYEIDIENRQFNDCFDYFKVKLAVGVPIMSLENNKKLNIFNGQRYLIKEIIQDKEQQLIITLDDNDNTIINLNQYKKYFTLCYAMTNHKVQGLTINEPYCIHECRHERSDIRWKYTALSRAKNQQQIKLCNIFIHKDLI